MNTKTRTQKQKLPRNQWNGKIIVIIIIIKYKKKPHSTEPEVQFLSYILLILDQRKSKKDLWIPSTQNANPKNLAPSSVIYQQKKKKKKLETLIFIFFFPSNFHYLESERTHKYNLHKTSLTKGIRLWQRNQQQQD